MKKQQIQIQEQTSAYAWKAVHDMFLMTTEFLEKYIEVAGYYPDWSSRKQIHDNNVRRKDKNAEEAEKSFSTMLFMFEGMLKNNPPLFRGKLKEEFYQWINATGINAQNCPERLKKVLFGIHELLEGRGEKILEDEKNAKRDYEVGSPEYATALSSAFLGMQAPLEKERETEQSLRGKSHNEISLGNNFGGEADRGRQTFQQIIGNVSGYQDFHFFPQQGQQSSPQNRTNTEIIQDIRQNPRNWRVDEIITEFDNFGGTSQEQVLIHQSARLDDYNQQTGKLNFEGNAIYLANRFSSEEQTQINQALNVSQSSQVQQPPYKWNWK